MPSSPNSFNPLESIAKYRSSALAIGSHSPVPSPASLNDLRQFSRKDKQTSQLQQSTASIQKSPIRRASVLAPRLATSQRRHEDQLALRLELEMELEKMRKLVSNLRTENKKIEEEKSALITKMKDQKLRSDETIISLRNTLAANGIKTGKTVSGGPTSSLHRGVSPSRSTHPDAYAPNKPYTPKDTDPHLFEAIESDANKANATGFMGPTFSELMRISTNNDSVFTNTLRKHKVRDWSETHQQIDKDKKGGKEMEQRDSYTKSVEGKMAVGAGGYRYSDDFYSGPLDSRRSQGKESGRYDSQDDGNSSEEEDSEIPCIDIDLSGLGGRQ